MASKQVDRAAAEPRPPRDVGDRFIAPAGPPGPDELWDNVTVANVDWASSKGRGWRMNGGKLTGVRAPGADWTGLRWEDVWCVTSDFANADLTASVLQRVDIRDVRFTGANFSECRLTDVRLIGCKLGQWTAHEAVFVRCRFDRCDLREADFDGADLRGVVFRDCDLRQVRLGTARVDGTDVRGSNLAGLSADPARLRGLVIDPSQAVDLVSLLDVVVRATSCGPGE